MKKPSKTPKTKSKTDKAEARPLGDDESALWQSVAGSITPKDARTGRRLTAYELSGEREFRVDENSEPKRAPKNKTLKSPASKTTIQPGGKPNAVLSRSPGRSQTPAALPELAHGRAALPELAHGRAPGLDRRNEQKLRRGNVEIESRLDLHGMTQATAHRALGDFIAASQAAGRRTVLVVTGRGVSAGGGVLKRAVPLWLNEAPNRGRVLGFALAQPHHGGDGALYIRLKRRAGAGADGKAGRRGMK